MQCYQQAISLVLRRNRPAKAALLAEAMVDVTPDKLSALKLAERYYEQADDRRGSQVRERIAHLLAESGRYSEAAGFFLHRAEDLAHDPVLIRSARKNALLALVCAVLAEQSSDWLPEWFFGTQEHHAFDHWLQYYSGQVEEFTCQLDLPQWLLKIGPSSSLR